MYLLVTFAEKQQTIVELCFHACSIAVFKNNGLLHHKTIFLVLYMDKSDKR